MRRQPSLIGSRIGSTQLGEGGLTQLATVAMAAGASLIIRIIAASGQPVIHAEFEPAGNDLSLGEVDQGGVNGDFAAAAPTLVPWRAAC